MLSKRKLKRFVTRFGLPRNLELTERDVEKNRPILLNRGITPIRWWRILYSLPIGFLQACRVRFWRGRIVDRASADDDARQSSWPGHRS